MVKQTEIDFAGAPQVEHPEYTLNAKNRLAKEYPHGNISEQVTVPDVSPSLFQMVTTGIAGNASGKYAFVDVDEDDHDAPDYEKLSNADPAVKAEFMEHFVNNPNNYETQEKNAEDVNTQKDEATAGGSEEDPTA